MPYATLQKQIESLPPEYYAQVENFVQYIIYRAKMESPRETSLELPNEKQKAFDDIFGILSHEDADEMRSNLGLRFKEV